MFHLRLLWELVIVLSSLTVIRALVEGDQFHFSRRNGTCVSFSICRPVLEALGTRFNICSFNSLEAVVCCPSDYHSQLQRIQQKDAAQSISIKNCKEYLRQSTPTVFLTSFKPNAEVIQKRAKQCSKDNKLIVGGEAAKPGEFPHMAALGYRSVPNDPIQYKCGGTLISDRFIMTAAHCTTQGLVTVRLGDLNLISDADGATPQEFSVEDTIAHPQYSAKSKHNDIALIKLVGKVVFSPTIRPACLYQMANVEEQKLTAAGYGAVENFGPNSNILMKVVLDQFDKPTCLKYYSRAGSSQLIDSQMCVGFKVGGRDTCQGDSGGPLQIRDLENDCLFHVVGITSYGTYCGEEVPAVYTRVGSYIPWIESIVWSG